MRRALHEVRVAVRAARELARQDGQGGVPTASQPARPEAAAGRRAAPAAPAEAGV